MHNIALISISDGDVQGHKAGCADLTRGKARRSTAWEFEVEDKAHAWLDYNSDFLAEGGEDNAYHIHWLPCAKRVPEGDTHARYQAAFGEDHTPVAYQTPEAKTDVTVKRGPKWSYIFVNGEQVMEVRSTLVDAVLATVDFS